MNTYIISRTNCENKKSYDHEDFFKVCENTGNFLDDQSETTIELFEYLVDNMDSDDFELELDLINNDSGYLCAVTSDYVDCINNDLLKIESVEDFIRNYIDENYGYNGLMVYELMCELLNDSFVDFSELANNLIMTECLETDEKDGYETYQYIHHINNEDVVIYIER